MQMDKAVKGGRWFWLYCAIWLCGIAVGVLAASFHVHVGPVGLAFAGLLLVGLARGMRVAWALLLFTHVVSGMAPWILNAQGSVSAGDLAYSCLQLVQIGLLLGLLRPSFRRQPSQLA